MMKIISRQRIAAFTVPLAISALAATGLLAQDGSDPGSWQLQAPAPFPAPRPKPAPAPTEPVRQTPPRQQPEAYQPPPARAFEAAKQGAPDAKHGATPPPEPSRQAAARQPRPVQVGQVARAANVLGARLLAEMVGPRGDRTIVMSPYGLSTTLNALSLGADGPTQATWRRTLGPIGLQESDVMAAQAALRRNLASINEPGLSVAAAASVWLAPRMVPHERFRASVWRAFEAEVKVADLTQPATLASINKWGSDATRGLVPKITDAVDPSLQLLLASAVYFKGTWTTAFDSALTTPDKFTKADGTTAQAMLMAGRLTTEYGRLRGLHVVALPYAGGRFRMLVATAEDPAQIQRAWQTLTTGTDVSSFIASVKLSRQPVDVRLPRLKVAADANMTEQLGRLGLASALQSNANYARLSQERIGPVAVWQRAVLEINETGTEAAVVTSAQAGRSLSDPVQFVADRPFVIALTDTATGALLFLGYIAEP